MLHEQSRPDRDEYVIIVKKHITTEMQIHFAKVPGMETHNTSYDVSSVMHFAFNEFSIDPKKPTIIPKRGFSGLKMGQREGISPLDAAKLKMLYSCQIDNDPEPGEQSELNDVSRAIGFLLQRAFSVFICCKATRVNAMARTARANLQSNVYQLLPLFRLSVRTDLVQSGAVTRTAFVEPNKFFEPNR